MWWRRVLLCTGALSVAAVVGLMVLFIGLKGAANYAESRCDADVAARTGYGAWSMSGELWPPSFTCEIGGSDVPPITISHPAVGLFVFVAKMLIPSMYVAFVVLSLWWIATRSFVDRRNTQGAG